MILHVIMIVWKGHSTMILFNLIILLIINFVVGFYYCFWNNHSEIQIKIVLNVLI